MLPKVGLKDCSGGTVRMKRCEVVHEFVFRLPWVTKFVGAIMNVLRRKSRVLLIATLGVLITKPPLECIRGIIKVLN